MSCFTTPSSCQKGVGESPTHIFMIEVAVPILGTAKNLYKRKLGLFAMYVCTSSVRTYIAKTLKRTIYETLYDAKVVSVNLTDTTQRRSSCHGDNSALVALVKMTNATALPKETSNG